MKATTATARLTAALRIVDERAYNALGRPFDAYRLQQRPQQPPRKHSRTALLALLLLLLASCATPRPIAMPERSQRFVVDSDARTRHAEPTPSRIR